MGKSFFLSGKEFFAELRLEFLSWWQTRENLINQIQKKILKKENAQTEVYLASYHRSRNMGHSDLLPRMWPSCGIQVMNGMNARSLLCATSRAEPGGRVSPSPPETCLISWRKITYICKEQQCKGRYINIYNIQIKCWRELRTNKWIPAGDMAEEFMWKSSSA